MTEPAARRRRGRSSLPEWRRPTVGYKQNPGRRWSAGPGSGSPRRSLFAGAVLVGLAPIVQLLRIGTVLRFVKRDDEERVDLERQRCAPIAPHRPDGGHRIEAAGTVVSEGLVRAVVV